MYQSNTDKFTEEDFKQLIENFEKRIIKFELDSSDNSEWDISKEYITNHACLWNKRENINKVCKIVQKNNKLALVRFIPQDKTYGDIFGKENMLRRLYRLEDLSIKNDK